MDAMCLDTLHVMLHDVNGMRCRLYAILCEMHCRLHDSYYTRHTTYLLRRISQLQPPEHTNSNHLQQIHIPASSSELSKCSGFSGFLVTVPAIVV